MGLGLCVHPAAKGDLITGQRRALSSQRRPLGIGLGTKPLPDGAPASGLPPLRHKLRGAEVVEGGRLQLVSGGHIHVSVHVHHQPQPPSKYGCRGLLPSKCQLFTLLLHSFHRWPWGCRRTSGG